MKLPSPIEKIEHPLFKEKEVEVLLKRDDLIHPTISGNKWRKLKLNVEQFNVGNYQSLLTFGGAFSNHIAATARAGKELGFPTIGIIRGEELNKNSNQTLSQAHDDGMKLIFTPRKEYALRDEKYYHEELRRRHGHVWIVPEGGKNYYGMLGCVEILNEIDEKFTHILTAAGTGTTASGLLYGTTNQTVVAVSALKGGIFLKDEIEKMLFKGGLTKDEIKQSINRLDLQLDFHFGGYAKKNSGLIDFMNNIYDKMKIKLDFVYTAKTFYCLFQLIESNYFSKGDRIITLHTGGLQGNRSIQEKLIY